MNHTLCNGCGRPNPSFHRFCEGCGRRNPYYGSSSAPFYPGASPYGFNPPPFPTYTASSHVCPGAPARRPVEDPPLDLNHPDVFVADGKTPSFLKPLPPGTPVWPCQDNCGAMFHKQYEAILHNQECSRNPRRNLRFLYSCWECMSDIKRPVLESKSALMQHLEHEHYWNIQFGPGEVNAVVESHLLHKLYTRERPDGHYELLNRAKTKLETERRRRGFSNMVDRETYEASVAEQEEKRRQAAAEAKAREEKQKRETAEAEAREAAAREEQERRDAATALQMSPRVASPTPSFPAPSDDDSRASLSAASTAVASSSSSPAPRHATSAGLQIPGSWSPPAHRDSARRTATVEAATEATEGLASLSLAPSTSAPRSSSANPPVDPASPTAAPRIPRSLILNPLGTQDSPFDHLNGRPGFECEIATRSISPGGGHTITYNYTFHVAGNTGNIAQGSYNGSPGF